jgi:hypothetical protein
MHGPLASDAKPCKETSALLQAESEGITWKSYVWNLPRDVLKFALNTSIDTLPTFTNLKRWGKRAFVTIQLALRWHG